MFFALCRSERALKVCKTTISKGKKCASVVALVSSASMVRVVAMIPVTSLLVCSSC